MEFDINPLGDSALTIRVASTTDEPARARVRAAVRALESARLPGVADIVPGFTTVTLHCDPQTTAWEALRERIDAALTPASGADAEEGRLIRIPVCYGGEFGPDLEEVAARASLSAEQVMDLHAAREYRVHVLGFLPGFAYLSGVDPLIATPRRSTPRDRVRAGSVGIAGDQTGVYPLDSPGGWQLIGRSPVVLFDPSRTPPTLLRPGDRIRFNAIDRAEFDRMQVAMP